MGKKRDYDWRELHKICELCGKKYHPTGEKRFSPRDWRNRRYCSMACGAKSSPRKPKNLVEKFWERVVNNGKNNCWGWSGSKAFFGYGTLGHGRKNIILAHRLSYEIHFSDPGDFFVCHKCDNTECTNPDHLFLGTHKDNMNDMVSKKRHIWGEKSYFSVLKEDQVKKIRKDTRSFYKIAKEYNVSSATISKIIKRKSWKNLPD